MPHGSVWLGKAFIFFYIVLSTGQLPNKFIGILLISCVRSFTESDLSDNDNIEPFKNTTLINLINLHYVL